MKRALIPYATTLMKSDEVHITSDAKIHVQGDDFDGFLRVMTDVSGQM
jgi:hypothetical protein